MAQPRNPFDNAFELMKELQGQVHELQAALEAERQHRNQEVTELRTQLAQERTERTSLCQQMSHEIENVSQRLNSAQDRIRFDMGDLRKALQKECDDRTANCDNISQSLDAESARLQAGLDAISATENSHYNELTTNLSTTNHNWTNAVHNLDAKLDAQVERLSANTSRVAADHAEFVRASKTMQNGVQHGVGIIMESIKTFGITPAGATAASHMVDTRPTPASTV
mmetsp:Transcript_78556/g.177418  ORF Transcript_78556/g.177418 Transcript_78556/m.177418 type:complete len:226 (+) Transcript_78556:100-777(+)